MTRRGWILFASMCVIWGVPYLMIRVAVRELSPSFLVLLRTGIGAALLLPLAARRDELRPLLRFWRPLLVFSAVEIALPWLLLARAEQEISSSLTGLLLAAVPLVGAAAVVVMRGDEGLGGRRLAGLLVGIVGVAAILGLDLGDVTAVPLLEVGVVAVCYAVGPIILARTLSGAPALGGVACARGGPVPTGRVPLRARVDALGACARVGRRPIRPLHGRGVPRLLRADRRSRTRTPDGVHVRQSCRRRGPGRRAPRRDLHPRDGNRVRARSRRLGARDVAQGGVRARGRPGLMARRGRHAAVVVPHSSTSSGAISSSCATCASGTAARAAPGISARSAVSGFSTIAAPPSSRIRARPRAPSSFAPVRTTPTQRSPYASAADSSSTSIDGRENATGSATDRARCSPSTSRW